MTQEDKFHNERTAFYISETGDVVYINKGQTHEDYFKQINHPEYINFIVRGYVLNNHIILYRGSNFDAPINFSIKVLLQWISPILHDYAIDWIGLGCHIGKVGEEWKPKIILKINSKNNQTIT